jgi:hypothetical protein
MKLLYRGLSTRTVTSSVVLAALVCACAPQSGLPSFNSAGIKPGRALAHAQKFKYTGKMQTFAVPAGVTQVTIVATGASGPSGSSRSSLYCQYVGGNGGSVKATVPVTPGENLAVFVGGEGHGATGSTTCGCALSGTAGGFNGGGHGGTGAYEGAGGCGGGGASDVRLGGSKLADRALVAGGGGGGGVAIGFYGAGGGGAGGGETGGTGGSGYPGSPEGYGGTGGTHNAGGTGGNGGQRGGYGRGASGHNGKLARGGAGGGSSYVEKNATHVKNLQGSASPGNGLIVISW